MRSSLTIRTSNDELKELQCNSTSLLLQFTPINDEVMVTSCKMKMFSICFSEIEHAFELIALGNEWKLRNIAKRDHVYGEIKYTHSH